MVDGSGPAAAPVTGRIFLTGGTGFVGTNLRSALAGRPLKLLVRDASRDPALASGDVEVVAGDVTDPASLRGALDGCEAAINLVAIIDEEGGATFDGVIRQGTAHVVAAAKAARVRRFLQMSALGTMHDPAFPYFEAKWQAEQVVKASGLAWTIFRPSIVFGPGDKFINVLADLVRKAPIIPVVGPGENRFQPVAVEEVATCFVAALDDPTTVGQTFELGGPDVLTYEQLLDLIATKLGKRKRKVHVPVGLMRPVVKLAKPLPKSLRPPVTAEQLKMLAVDNSTEQSATARLIGRAPRRLADGIDYIVDGAERGRSETLG
jgi:uncharacterized protein YbjT (DUF2867 family)